MSDKIKLLVTKYKGTVYMQVGQTTFILDPTKSSKFVSERPEGSLELLEKLYTVLNVEFTTMEL